MKWYIPAWNGDVRLIPHPESSKQTVMLVEKPTADEQRIVNVVGADLSTRGWLKDWTVFDPKAGLLSARKWEFVIDAPLVEVGPVVASIMRPGPAVLTAIRFENGQCITTSGSPAELAELAKSAYREAEKPQEKTEEITTDADQAKPKAKAKSKPSPGDPKAAATVQRPTPCCPQCMQGAIEPATEVLLDFLDDEQHRDWAKSRSLVVAGGLTGNRYLLAHRNSQTASRIGRICYDLDDECVVHFHDSSVPPEEEVLGAMLILQHREPWLRNEATMLGLSPSSRSGSFKNPFGDFLDGAFDAQMMRDIGNLMGVR